MFICILYVAQSSEVKSSQERGKKLLLSPLFMVLQQVKVLSGIESVHKKHSELAGYDEQFNLMTLEGCFKI
jgi:hypothetical protein